MRDTELVLAAAALTWVSLVSASVLRSRSWTRAGRELAFGNREALPEPSPLAGRADRAAKNNLENLVLFVCVWAAARAAGAAPSTLGAGAHLFVWSRAAYTLAYLAGIRYLRTALWLAGVLAMAMIGARAL